MFLTDIRTFNVNLHPTVAHKPCFVWKVPGITFVYLLFTTCWDCSIDFNAQNPNVFIQTTEIKDLLLVPRKPLLSNLKRFDWFEFTMESRGHGLQKNMKHGDRSLRAAVDFSCGKPPNKRPEQRCVWGSPLQLIPDLQSLSTAQIWQECKEKKLKYDFHPTWFHYISRVDLLSVKTFFFSTGTTSTSRFSRLSWSSTSSQISTWCRL